MIFLMSCTLNYWRPQVGAQLLDFSRFAHEQKLLIVDSKIAGDFPSFHAEELSSLFKN